LLFGYRKEELERGAASWTTRIHPEDRERVVSGIHRAIDSGAAYWSDEYRFLRADGSVADIYDRGYVIRDADGRPQRMIGAMMDISERKKAELALRESERFARATIDALGMHVCVIDEQGAIVAVNKAWCRLAEENGYAADTRWPGVNYLQVCDKATGMSAADVAFVGSGIHDLLSGHRDDFTFEYSCRWGNEQRWYALKATRFPGSGVRRAVISHENITERTLSNRRRAMEHAVTRVLAESATVEAAMPRLLRTICEALDWAYGAHWSWDRQSQTLSRTGYWADMAVEFETDDAGRWQAIDSMTRDGLLRRALLDQAPTWIVDLREDATFHRQASARKLGFVSAYSFPIFADRELVGVMEFFGREARQPDEMLQQITLSIGAQIGQFVQRKQAEAALRDSEENFRQLAGNIPEIFWMTDAGQRSLIYLSPAYEAITGRSTDEVRRDPRRWLDAVHPDDRERVRAARKAIPDSDYDLEYRVLTADGRTRWIHDQAFPVRDGEGRVYRIAGISSDVTQRKEAEEKLVYLAHYDGLTGLPNRTLFQDRLEQTLAQAGRRGWLVAVMFIDLDRFKIANDTLGHSAGDQLLKQVAQRLSDCVRTGDTVGRFGGDEFGLILSDLRNAEDARLVAQKVLAVFGRPFLIEGNEVYVTASIGISMYPPDSTDGEALMKNADAAMYRAKESGRNAFQFFTREMNERALRRLDLENSLRRALERGEFLLYYQPKASLKTGELTGFEALLRWQRPGHGLVPPNEFVPLLEDTGLIVPVGEWVLASACRQMRQWQLAGVQPVPIAVNLAARQFASTNLGATVKRIIDEHGVDPRYIELELTESSLMINTEEAVQTLSYLKSLGLRLSIDDLGTGYSSLSYLKRFPIDALKIDRSFVRDITTDVDDATITRAVIGMAHNLELKVVAEGVENQAQIAFLSANDCDEIQGYYLSRPLTAEDCERWLREGRRLHHPALGVDEAAPTVLLVDDDDDNIVLVKRQLARDGYRVLSARDALEGLEVLSRQRVDVVVSDQEMPGMSGVDFLQQVKMLYPRAARLMLSGHEDFQTVTDAVNRSEILRFLPKSLGPQQIRAGIRQALLARERG
jgi:diguanylate cyclase (GGDEF)-like protein/PAS domain S-box-containing protein